MNYRRIFAFALLAAGCVAATPAPSQAQAKQPACDADNGGITLPPGFCALVVADGLGTARHIAVADNGDIYVSLQNGRNGGGVVALHDSTGSGKFDVKMPFGKDSTTGIAVQNGYLYVAKFHSVERYKMTPGQLVPPGEPETVVMGLPGMQEHGDKTITFDGNGFLYVNVGSPSNACQAKDRQPHSPGQDPCPLLEKNGGVWKFDENKLAPACARSRPSRGDRALCTSP
jgi:glucose/arabinose dehydrogenase